MMRIAIVAQPFDPMPPTTCGSLGIWADELAKELSRRHQVSIYSRLVGEESDDELIDGIRHVRTETARDERTLRFFQRVGRIGNRILRRRTYLYYARYYFSRLYYRGYVNEVAKKIAANDDQLILVINFSQFLQPLRAHNRSSKIILVMQCDWLVELEASRISKRLNLVDAVLGCSDYITSGIAKQYPEHADKCGTLYNASNVDRFRSANGVNSQVQDVKKSLGLGEKTVVTFVGRVAPEKGVHVLIEAMKKIAAVRDDAVLLVIGGISIQPPSPLWLRHKDPTFRETEWLKQRYHRYIPDLCADYTKVIRLLGSVSHYDLPSYYGITDIFVHPAIWNEPFGMILTEAMAAKCPIISTRVGGIPEIVDHGKTGLLVAPNDSDALATAICELADDKEKRRSMGLQGQKRVQSLFTWNVAAARLERVIDSLSQCPTAMPEE